MDDLDPDATPGELHTAAVDQVTEVCDTFEAGVHVDLDVEALHSLLQLLLDQHQPVVDPDGEALCQHCVGSESVFMWPCAYAEGVMRAVGVLT